jgi:adenylyltransferase/sulfurtransferase
MVQPLTPDELLRYGRQITLAEVGEAGQRKLRDARVLLVGAGGLGSPVALYLAAAGVGTLGIVEPDWVDPSNLHRQVLHGAGDVGRKKLDSARDRLLALNPAVRIEPHDAWFYVDNALSLVQAYDLVVDGTDSFETRYLVNDACVLAGKPNFYGSVFRFEGQATVLCAPGGPCYRCLYPEPPPPGVVPSCAEGGVLPVVPGLVGLIQATEVLKWITGAGTPLVGRLLLVDALGPEFRTVRVHPDPRCPACGTREIREVRPAPFTCALPPAGSAHEGAGAALGGDADPSAGRDR